MSTSPDSLGKDARALLRAARGGDDVSPEERRRLLEAFAQQRAVEPVARAGRVSAGRGWRRRGVAPRLSWAVAALVLTGSLAALARHQGLLQRLGAWMEEVRDAEPEAPVSGAGARKGDRRGSHPPAALVAPRPVQPPELAVPAADEPAPRVSPPSRGSAQARTPHVAGGFAAEELELIAAARTALGERRFDAARQHAEQHAQRFPRGTFSEEREAILALCECRGQRSSERGQRFVHERPGSLLAERVRRDCGLSANLVPGAKEPDTH